MLAARWILGPQDLRIGAVGQFCGSPDEIKAWEQSQGDPVYLDYNATTPMDPRVLEAMRSVPRHLFVPPAEEVSAYDDRPLPIGSGQTISQPYVVAFMAEQLRLTGKEKVLEIGTGSGYSTAILAALATKVFAKTGPARSADTRRSR